MAGWIGGCLLLLETSSTCYKWHRIRNSQPRRTSCRPGIAILPPVKTAVAYQIGREKDVPLEGPVELVHYDEVAYRDLEILEDIDDPTLPPLFVL